MFYCMCVNRSMNGRPVITYSSTVDTYVGMHIQSILYYHICMRTELCNKLSMHSYVLLYVHEQIHEQSTCDDIQYHSRYIGT